MKKKTLDEGLQEMEEVLKLKIMWVKNEYGVNYKDIAIGSNIDVTRFYNFMRNATKLNMQEQIQIVQFIKELEEKRGEILEKLNVEGIVKWLN